MPSQKIQVITLSPNYIHATRLVPWLSLRPLQTSKGIRQFLNVARTSTALSSTRYRLCSSHISHVPVNIDNVRARQICSSAHLQSGHSRWSKIKHDKAKADSSKNRQRSEISRELSVAVKENGPDPNLNPTLARLIAAAKKMGFPKASIETAIARGQGQSPSGAALEPLTIELLHSATGVAGVIDVLTDSKGRSLQDIRDVLRRNGATVAPVAYMFERRGMLLYSSGSGKNKITITEEALMDAALDAGAVDIHPFQDAEPSDTIQTDGAVSGGYVYTEPSELTAVAERMAKALAVKPERMEMVWTPREDTIVKASEGDGWKQLDDLVEKLEDDPTIVGVYLNTR